MLLKVARFRELHDNAIPFRLPNAWDAGSARLFEHIGAEAVATTAAGIAWSMGYRDGRTVPFEDVRSAIGRMLRVVSVPISVNIEGGFSDSPRAVADHVVQLVDMGVAGINIEDGADNAQFLAAKIEVIRGTLARLNLDTFVNVRSDVFLKQLVDEQHQVSETVARGRLYAEAGADGMFLPGLVHNEQIRAIASAVSLPLNLMTWPGLADAKVLGEMGVRRLSAGPSINQVVWGKAKQLCEEFLRSGSSTVLVEDRLSFSCLQSLFSDDPFAALWAC